MLRTAAILMFGTLVAGCASTPPAPPAREARPGVAAARPEPGMDLAWWIVDEGGRDTPALREALRPYESRPVPVSWQAVDVWHANGLRLLAVPLGELDALRARLHIVGPMQNQWLGEATRWTEIARGPRVGGSYALGLDNGPLALRDGHLRLMMRCWIGPARGDAEGAGPLAAMQVEMVPEFLPARRPRSISMPGAEDDPASRPLTLSRLFLETCLTGDEALLIVPEGASVQPGREPSGVGPRDATLPSLGETLLATADEARNRRARVIVVLTPSVPRQFRLLPDAQVR